MNNNQMLWLDILDKSKELFLTANCPEINRENLTSILADLETFEKYLSINQNFTLAFSGMTNVGKSTLLNALLGDSVAPTKNCPWSSTAVEYQYLKDKYEIIVPLINFKSIHKQFDTSAELLAELKKFAVHGSAYQTDKPLIVRLPNDLLLGDITIVDTPGFGASDGSNEDFLHDDVLISYLQKRKEQIRIFWIVKDNIGDSSISFYAKHLAKFCTDLIVNLTDEFDDEFIKHFEELYKPAVGHTVRFHYVDAKTAIKAEKNNDMELLKKSGIIDLKSYLSSFSSTTGRIKLIEEDLTMLFQNISDFLYLTNHFSCTWQPTTWGTLSSLLRKVDSPNLYKKFLELKGK